MLKPFKKGHIVLLAILFMLEMRVVVAKEPMKVPVHPIPLEIQTKNGTVSYKVEIAFTPSQAAAGLMYRTDFPRDRAMLFKQQESYSSGDEQKFFMWMANTPLPLDMIFLNSEGIIVSIIENTSPFSKKTISSGVPAAFALEVNAGEVSEKQIQKGQRVIHPVVCGKCNEK
ncbi:DUF192 domain-containing protein [Bartonella tribocorum]|uniref:DUF192 domain-containing protein n=1 Tax=Bartonella tribocorum TaxID=85701 RepID=A0A2M6URB8_9HYPH|nr:DUF192 domain-containing protein [Bartonella tribocorum]PIT68730.1 hypothetical protein CER18_05960 [Bartonella tribocorum]